MRWAPFLDGYDLTNLTIGGENGTIDGSGAFFWALHDAKQEDDLHAASTLVLRPLHGHGAGGHNVPQCGLLDYPPGARPSANRTANLYIGPKRRPQHW